MSSAKSLCVCGVSQEITRKIARVVPHPGDYSTSGDFSEVEKRIALQCGVRESQYDQWLSCGECLLMDRPEVEA